MTSFLDRLRNPDHTGERRCWPCTVTNAVLLGLACVGLARRRSRTLAAALGVGGVAAIALRGYFVPFTPRFAPQLTQRLPGNVFHADAGEDREQRHAPDSPGSLGGETDEETGEAVLQSLLERGVVVADGETLYLAEDFRDEWREKVQALRGRDDRGLADALRESAPEETVTEIVEQDGGRFGEAERWFVVSDGSGDPAREQWLTRPIAVAEIGAVRALADSTSLSATRRAQSAGALRMLLETCPVCDGPVEETTEVECCGGPGGTRADAPDDVLACGDCGSRLYTFQ
ncbi:hypothetical protein [Halorussus lipolyticus]|uniref:hypothetical protein n=1 Tax=Halorussus lipolyticus TaxID=3034024 RepID=UPI0023E79C75|nr:hypothetical protein [Halorussus sp. DT80]